MADSLTIIDNRTEKDLELPIIYGTYPEYGAAIPAKELRAIKASDTDFGMLSYDPGFTNTASCKSAVTFIDGEKGILRYRGYPIEQLAESSDYLEVAYLSLFGELPTQTELDRWVYDITHHTFLHENMKDLMAAFRYDAHPMGMFVSAIAALSTFYPEARQIDDPEIRLKQMGAERDLLVAWVRDVLATHVLKQTGSYEQAGYAIQDTAEMVAQHYGRFLPQDKAALAAKVLNRVWED